MPLLLSGVGMPPSKGKKNSTAYQPPLPPRWKGRDSLELVYQLNERALTLLSEAATQQIGCWPESGQFRAAWAGLSAEVLARAARFPFVVLDARFMDEPWWRARVNDTESSADDLVQKSAWPPQMREELFGELLVFAWHTVKWDQRVARLSLGMLPSVVDVIAGLTPRKLAVISARDAGVLRLRWQEDPEFWARLMVAARDGDEKGLSDSQLHAKLLLSGPLLTSPRRFKE
jgi:hypothetical protein